MKKIIAFTIIVLSLSFTQNIFAQTKIGTFDLQYVLPLLPEYKVAESSMKTYGDQISKELEAKRKEFQQKYAEFNEKKATWPQSIAQAKVAELQTMEQQIAEFEQKAPQDVREREAKLLSPIYEKVEKVIKEIAETNAYSYIIRSELAYVGIEANNISDVVLKKLGVTPPPKK